MFWRRDRGRFLYLIKADNEGLSFCECKVAPVDFPLLFMGMHPLDCAGWTFTCADCGQIFMFARAAWLPGRIEEFALTQSPRSRRCFDPQSGTTTDLVVIRDVEHWLSEMKPLLHGLREGERYVFFDGKILRAIDGPVRFKGTTREHDLPFLPHMHPSSDSKAGLLLDGDYWSGGI